MAFVGGFEPPAFRLGGGPSILLRYTNIKIKILKNYTDFYTDFIFMRQKLLKTTKI